LAGIELEAAISNWSIVAKYFTNLKNFGFLRLHRDSRNPTLALSVPCDR
jgi:hypothetical protein